MGITTGTGGKGNVSTNSSLFLLLPLWFPQLGVLRTGLGSVWLPPPGGNVCKSPGDGSFCASPGQGPSTQGHHGTRHGNKRMVPKSQRLWSSNTAHVEPGKCPRLVRKCLFLRRGVWTMTHLTMLNNFRSLAPALRIYWLNHPNTLFFGEILGPACSCVLVPHSPGVCQREQICSWWLQAMVGRLINVHTKLFWINYSYK